MFETASDVIIAFVILLAGGAIGAAVMKFWNPQKNARRELEERLQKAERELENYREEVTQHFMETSHLINNLTQSYRDVHQHLANSAMKLTSPTISQQFLKQMEPERETAIKADDKSMANIDDTGKNSGRKTTFYSEQLAAADRHYSDYEEEEEASRW